MDGDILALIVAMTIVILTFGTITGSLKRKHKLKALEIEARIAEAKAAKPEITTPDVEDRLRVLERIVTDPANNLSQQIEDLRAETVETK